MLDSASESSLVTPCGCDEKSTTGTGPQALLLDVHEDKKHQSATKNQKNVHSYKNKEQVQDVPVRGRDRQRLPELSDCSSFSQDLHERGSTYSNLTEAGYGHQTDCCNCDCPSQRSKYKNPTRESAGSDHAYITGLKNNISTASLNGEVAKLKGLSASIQDKLSAAVSCGTSVMSVLERTSNEYLSTASSKSKIPSSQLKQKSSSLLLNHQFSEKSPSTQLVTQSSNSIRQSIPQSQSSFRTSTSQTKNSLRHLTPQSKRTFIQSKSSFKPSSLQRKSPFKPSSPQLKSPLRLSPFPSKNSLKPSKSPLTKHPRSGPSIINLGKSSSESKSNKHHIIPSECALRQSESSFFPLRQFESPLKQSESYFFPLRHFESPLNESSSKQSESFLQKSESPARQVLHNQSKSPFKRSCTHFKSQSTNTSKNLQSKKETPFQKPLLQSEANNTTRLQSGGNTPFKQSYSLNYIYSQPEDNISNVKNVYHKSRGTSLFTYSRQNTEANSQPKPNSATGHRSKTNILSKPNHSKTDENSSSSPQSEVIHTTVAYVHGSKANSAPKHSNQNFEANSSTRQQARANGTLKQPEPKGNSSTLKNFHHRSRANTPSKHFNLNSEASSSTKYLSAQSEPKANSAIEHVRHRSRTNSPSKQFNPNSEGSSSIKYLSAQSDAKSSALHRSRANSPSKHFNPSSEANSSLKYFSAQPEPEATSTIEHNHHRSRANSPSKHFNPSSQANNSSKYLSAQFEAKSRAGHRSRGNSPLKITEPAAYGSTLEHVRHVRSRLNSATKHSNPNSEAGSYSKYLSAQSEANSSSRHRSRANSPSKPYHPKSERNDSVKQTEASNNTLKRFTSRSRANNLLKLYPSRKNFPKPNLRQSVTNNSLKYLSGQFQRPAYDSTLKRARSWEHGLLKRPSRVYTSSDSISISSSPPSLNEKISTQSLPKHCTKEIGCQSQFESQANDSILKHSLSLSRFYSPLKTTPANITLNITIPTQTEKKSYLKSVLSPRTVVKPCTKEVGCQKENDHTDEDDVRKSNLSTLKAVLNQTFNPVRQAAGYQDSQTQTELSVLKTRSKSTSTNKSESLISMRQMAGYQSDNLKKNSCCKCQCKCEQRKEETILPRVLYEDEILPRKSKEISILPDYQSDNPKRDPCCKCQCKYGPRGENALSPRKSVEEDFLPRKSRDEDILPSIFQEEEISTRKSREEDILPRKSIEDDFSPRKSIQDDFLPRQSREEEILPRKIREESISPRRSREESILPRGSREESISSRRSREESILPRGSREESISSRRSREESILPRGSREESISPRRSREEKTLSRNSREEENLPRRSREGGTLSRKSREEDCLSRKSRTEEKLSILPRKSTKQSFVGGDISEDIAEKRRSTWSNESSNKSTQKSCEAVGCPFSTRSALEPDEPSPEIATILRRQSLRNSISNSPENNCKCVQVTPSLLDVPDISLSKTKRFSIVTSDAPNDAQITYEPNTKSKSKTKMPKKPDCDNPAYYPPLLDCNVLVRNPNFSISKPAPSPSCILVKNCLRQSVSSKTSIQNKPINSSASESSSWPNNSSINSGAYARASQSQSDQQSCYGCDSDCCQYKSSTGRRPSARQSKSQSVDNFNDYSENRLSDTPNPARIQVLANSRKSNNPGLKCIQQSAATQADLKKSNTTNITLNSRNQRTRCQSDNAEQIKCKFGTQNPTSIQVLAVSRSSNTPEPAEQEDFRKSIQEEPKVVQQILVESKDFDNADDASGVSNSSLTKICKNVHDYPELTPLERPNAIENLKKELICAFPTTCACNPCFKIYPKTGCSCNVKQNNKKKRSCCSSTARTQLVCSNNHSSPSKLPSHKANYCYNPGCCPAQDCTSAGKAPLVCCTIDPFEALNRTLNQRPKPVCQEKCIIEELLSGDCNRSTADESDCNCNCNCNSSDTLVTDNSDGYRSSGGNDCTRNNDCCQPRSHLDPICCCCCTYPSERTDVGFWAKQVAINNISALPCAQQSADPENGAEKITGENCVPPCRCCCKTRKRPAAPNYCKTKSCCTETSPCCSESQSLCCNGDEEENTESDCCCCCSQTPCCCTVDTTAPGPVCFYCKSLPCRCCDEELDCSGSVCRYKGGGTMSNDYDYSTEKDCSVRVAVRIRPQNPREVIDMCRICTTVTPGEPHVILGQDKAFTFDYVYDINCIQCDIYTTCVERLVEGALRGYNATVLAYGQTGSGKTFTMGTGFDHDLNEIQQGIIPRAVRHIFAGIEEMQQHEYDDTGTQINTTQFSVGAQFMELYNEEIFDLLDPYSKGRGGGFKIHEDCTGQITVSGATISPVHGPQDALRCLQQGALARTTAATQMNEQSSRSHALFTILIRRQRMLTPDESGCPEGDLETLTSKFHFVDLAGSERLKRTGATGERAREGISINSGLLALGNCISALGDKSKKATHVPYRDSKLTRLLQDSLGGNSQTLMIACVSPCDRDFMETLNTLKYANRARNIKNKVQLNQDQSSRTIAQLRREIAALQMELLEYKQGKRLLDDEGNSCISDTFHENSMLLADNKRLQQRLKAMQETINVLTDNNTTLKVEKETHGWSTSLDSDRSVTNMVAGYLSEIEKLHAKLIESEEMYQQVKKNASGGSSHRAAAKLNGMENPQDLINMAKRELEKDRELLMSRSLPGLQEDTNNSNNMGTTAINNESFESDSDTESDDKANEMQADLIDINTDIEIKTKLIEQLELSQQRMQLMRQHYEDKLSLLNSKIVNTQKERDEVLANMGPTPVNQPNEKVKKVKEEYERKINDMQREMKKLQQAQREHLRQQRELQAQEVKVRNLRTELTELKCIKTRLIRKMTEQTNKHKEEETRKAREIAQLRKEQRRQQNAVKSLQAQVHAKDQILKRKTEEVTALRRSKRDKLSQKASGRVPSKHREKDIAYNSRQTRQRWDNLYRAITRASRNKQAVMQLEKELERLMNERETLCRDLTVVQKRQRTSGTKNIDLANEEDTIKSNLNYVQDNIAHVQQAIMEFEESKDTSSNDTQNLQLLIQNVNNMDEAKFLLEHLTNSAIMFQCDSALTQNRLAEHESLLKEVQQESSIQQQLLQHFLAQNNSIQISDLFASLHLDGSGDKEKLNTNNLSGSQKSLNSNGTYDIPCDGGGNMSSSYIVQRRSVSRSPSPTPTVDLLHDKTAKVRRRTAQPQDLLFGEVSHNGDDAMTRSYTQQDTTQRNFHPLMRVPSAPGSLKQALNSPSLTKKNIETAMASTTQPQSPRLTRRGMPNKGSPGLDDDAFIAPQSPPVYRKMISREENSNGSGGSTDVFSRLGAGIQDPAPGGSIHKVTGKIRVGVPLYCTHTVSGHNNSVLNIKVDDDDILYTAAADRTVKVWDLSREIAQHCLSTHPGPVIAVQNDKTTRLLFSASGPYVRVWDLRTSNSKPIKTLTSSGQVLAGNANITGVAPGESPITALCLGNSGNLYVAASDKVRIWDLKNISCVGKLSGGHQAAVMCVTAWEGDGGDSDGSTDFVATGSKDHYVKVFEVPKAGGVVYPLLNLEPPHYDGVQALAVAPDAVGADAELFSGSRDSGIKRWDLKSGELKQSLNNAHKGWVSGMAISGDVLLSSCRGGIVRLWNVRTCESLAELKTDLMINDIVASGQRVFTASSSGEVRIWRFAPQEHFPTSNMTSSSIEKK